MCGGGGAPPFVVRAIVVVRLAIVPRYAITHRTTESEDESSALHSRHLRWDPRGIANLMKFYHFSLSDENCHNYYG